MCVSNLTLFTDASHDPQTGDTGGGYWAVFDGERVCGGLRKRGIPTSNEAEIRVACGAIKSVLRHPKVINWLTEVDVLQIILVVDCLGIKAAFENPKAKKCYPLTGEVRQLLQERGVHLKVNHVKGHAGGYQPRDWVNRWCDKKAREARRSLTLGTSEAMSRG